MGNNFVKCSYPGVQYDDWFKPNEPINLSFVRRIKIDKRNGYGLIWFEYDKDDKYYWSYERAENWEYLIDWDYNKIRDLCK